MYAHFLPRSLWKKFSRQRSYWERKLWKKTPIVEKDFYYYVGDKIFYNEDEAKLYAQRENMAYRKFLRSMRVTNEVARECLIVSDPIDYLPYLYAKGKFYSSNKNIISFKLLQPYKGAVDGKVFEREQVLIIRDENGIYWKAIDFEEWRELRS